MAVIKQKVIQMIKNLPDDVTVDDIISELYFKIQVDAGIEELDKGKGISHDRVKERLSKWTTE